MPDALACSKSALAGLARMAPFYLRPAGGRRQALLVSFSIHLRSTKEKMSRRAASSKRAGSPPPPAKNDDGNAPSGFVLKLFQMVNGAPDEIVSVSRLSSFPSAERKVGTFVLSR